MDFLKRVLSTIYYCRKCGKDFTGDNNWQHCPHCGSGDIGA
ncbi:hydrogenase maturation nickel metallochaperone HypA [Pontibacillus sp. ALD_SL1]|nr:hydrogenase maturation nickel metallochaperone HypA [Pontibacillus sp. ALD_SL1]